jgi:hypothetical protein
MLTDILEKLNRKIECEGVNWIELVQDRSKVGLT